MPVGIKTSENVKYVFFMNINIYVNVIYVSGHRTGTSMAWLCAVDQDLTHPTNRPGATVHKRRSSVHHATLPAVVVLLSNPAWND